jgi:predicted dehydrogenase
LLKVGLIGLGHIGMLHLRNCKHIDDVKVVAVADNSKSALKKAENNGVENTFDDYHDLFLNSNDIDSVIISLPNFLHFDCIKLALENGLNVFVEKPMANTVDECREIVKLVEKSGRKLMVGHTMRFYEAIEKMKEKESKGRIGDLEVVTLEAIMNGPFTHPAVPKRVPEWWFDPDKAGGGVLLDIGYHLIDLYRLFVGDSKVIFSNLDYKFNLPIEDGAIVILRSSNSTTKGIINLGWYQKLIFPQNNFRCILHGNSGYLSSDDLVPKNMYIHAVKEGIRNFFRKITGRKIRYLSYTYYYEAYYKELVHFFDCIKHDREPEISVYEGLKTMELIEEAYDFFNKNKLLE